MFPINPLLRLNAIIPPVGLVEQALEKAANITYNPEVIGRQSLQNELVRDFMLGNIDFTSLKQGLLHLGQDVDAIVLPSPGPLYGLLRELGVNIDKAKERTAEEKAHYLATKEAGLNSRILIVFSGESDNSSSGIKKGSMDVFLAYQIPDEMREEEVRSAIQKISLAPESPSADDLAKLPSQI